MFETEKKRELDASKQINFHNIILNNVRQHNTLLHNVIACATCFDYLSVILRPIFVN